MWPLVDIQSLSGKEMSDATFERRGVNCTTPIFFTFFAVYLTENVTVK